MLYHLLYPIHESIGAFRVFRYITFRSSAAILTALFICFILGPYLINLLSRKQLGQVIREDGPESHLKKAGTPTMGGILILLATAFSTPTLGAARQYVYLASAFRIYRYGQHRIP